MAEQQQQQQQHPPWRGTMSEVPFSMSFLLDRGARIQPENLIVEKTATGYHCVTYSEHAAHARNLAAALAFVGVRRGDRVATFCWNTNRHFAAYVTRHGRPFSSPPRRRPPPAYAARLCRLLPAACCLNRRPSTLGRRR